MGLLKGNIDVDAASEELAYSEDSAVSPGTLRGCGWCPVEAFAQVARDADVCTFRALTARERNQYRNLMSAGKPADANLYAFTAALESVQTVQGGKRRILKGSDAARWAEELARVSPVPIDLGADRILHVTSGGRPEELYPGIRRALGVDEPAQEGLDGACKSDDGDAAAAP